MKRVIPSIVFLIILVGLYVLSNKPSGADRSLEKQRTQYLRRIDSLNYAFAIKERKDMELTKRLADSVAGFQIALKRASKVRIQYEKIRPITDADSLAFALTELGYHVVLLPPGSIKDGI